MRYVDGKPHSIDTVVLSSQHSPTMSRPNKMTPSARGGDRDVIKPVLPKHVADKNTATWSTRPAASSSAARKATAA